MQYNTRFIAAFLGQFRDLQFMCASNIQMSAYGHLSEPSDEGVGMSQEYRGEQGRFLPPRTPHRPGGNYTRSLSSQL